VTYEESLAYLSSLGRFGIKLGLERTRALLNELGNPQELFQGVLVAGTNGKGSVCAMLAAVLQEAGYSVGFMPKPHLVSYTERIQVNQKPITEADFAALLTSLQPMIDRVAAEHGPPTEFEILTTAALDYFARAGIDLLVCEVGLGGRLDSTNVLDLGVEVITNIALDHTQYLGTTLEAIAAEKAGILKPESLAITGARPMIARPSGSSPNTASPNRSNTFSAGSSSYIAISSRITARSESTSVRAGLNTMSVITSKASGTCSSMTRA